MYGHTEKNSDSTENLQPQNGADRNRLRFLVPEFFHIKPQPWMTIIKCRTCCYTLLVYIKPQHLREAPQHRLLHITSRHQATTTMKLFGTFTALLYSTSSHKNQKRFCITENQSRTLMISSTIFIGTEGSPERVLSKQSECLKASSITSFIL